MSIESALEFIQSLRSRDDLQKQLSADNDGMNLKKLVLVAHQTGYRCSEDELIVAHKHDWAIRWWTYNRS